jgi:predicted Zn-dependent protease
MIFLAIALLTPSGQQLKAQEAPPQVTPEEAAQLQKKLQADPGNLEAHTRLLAYYQFHSESKFVEQLIWFIDHHPDSDVLWPLMVHLNVRSAASLRRLRAAWEHAVVANPKLPGVDLNAGVFFIEQGDPQRALNLLRAGASLKPNDLKLYMDEIAQLYAMAEVKVLLPGQDLPFIDYFVRGPALASRLANELEQSRDPALLSAVGSTMAYIFIEKEAIQKKALNLMQRAINIDPANPKWKETLAQVNAMKQVGERKPAQK